MPIIKDINNDEELITINKYPCENWTFAAVQFINEYKGEMEFVITEGDINRIIKFINNPSFQYDVSANDETLLRLTDVGGTVTMFITYRTKDDTFHIEIGQYSDDENMEEYDDVDFECEYEVTADISQMLELRDELFKYVAK